jgi:hypothetical protein
MKMSIASRIHNASKVLNIYMDPPPSLFQRIAILSDILMMRILYGYLLADYCSYEFHRLKLSERKTFLGEMNGVKLAKLFNKASDEIKFKNKIIFNRIFAKYLQRDWLSMNDCTYKEFCDFCAAHPEYIKKPVDKKGGAGIEKHTISSDSNLLELYNKLQGENCLLEEIIIQDQAIASFNPGSVNTCRVYSVLNESKVIFVDAYLRTGIADVVDNFCMGGIAAKIDVGTGIITTHGKNMWGKTYISHPATKKQYIGFEIPRWAEIKKTVEEIATVVPTVRYVGWDVVINKKGDICVIEGNQYGSINLQEMVDLKGKKSIYEKLLQDIK